MGILDDAIREHLELKRQHGAESDDLERLENEAFGALARPGDPDFTESGSTEGEGTDGEGEAGAEPAPARDTSDWLAGEDPTTVAPVVEERSEPTAAQQARAEHPHLEDTADHDGPEIGPGGTVRAEAPAAPEPPPMEEPLPPSQTEATESSIRESAEEDPPEAPERGIFDADADDIDFGDLDLDEEDDGTVGRQPASAEPSPFVVEEDDLSLDLDDDEETLAEELSAAPFTEPTPPPGSAIEDDTGNPPLPVPPRAPDLDEPSAPGDTPEGEDLLEETPDFLKDTPEGDRAWFEQDPPKDFDFDDD